MAYSRQNTSDIVWRGVYNATRTYYPGDWVTYNGQVYRAVLQTTTTPQATNVTDSVPVLGTTNASAWQLNSNATFTGASEVRLTTATNSITGSTFYKTPVSLLHNLTVSFQSECSGGSGADGYRFYLLDTRYGYAPTSNVTGAPTSGGFGTVFETWSGAPPSATLYWRDNGAATPTTVSATNSDTTANLRAISNWVFTFTRTGTNTCTVGITKGGVTYGGAPYSNVFVPDSAYIGFSAATGGANDNQYIRNFSAVSGGYQGWQAVNTTIYSGTGAPTAGYYDPNSLYLDTTLHTLYIWNGATPTWIPLGVNRPTTVTTNYSMTLLDQIVLANGSSLTVTLPDPTVAIDRPYTIKNLNPSSVTVNSPSGNIDGTTNQTLAQYATIRAVSDGSNWWAV